MTIIQKTLTGLFVLMLLFDTAPAFAQSPDPFGNRAQADTSISYSPPAIYVTKINLEPISATNEIKGKFMVWNNDKETIGGLLYRIDLLDPLPEPDPNTGSVEDNSALYDRFVSSDQFSLSPNERKEIAFSYNPPALPEGKYRIQITATNSRGRDMGWWNEDVSLSSQKTGFIKLVTGPLLSPEYPDRKFPSQAGPNITPGKYINLNVSALNNFETPANIIPVLYIYEFDIARGLFDKIKIPAVKIPAGDAKNISFPLQVASKPGVYYGLLTLEDFTSNQKVSNLAEYRWVVKGEHAEVISMRIIKNATKKDQEMMVRVDLVGSADAFTKTKVDLNVAIKDSDGIVGNIDVKSAELTDGVATTQGPIKLTRDLKNNSEIIATIKDQKGNQIDQYIIPLTENSTPTIPPKSYKSIQIGVAIILLAGAGLYGIKNIFKKIKKM
ncbi:MAG: hypothetical protein Q7S57_04815 [bacterium]|nr:hypothetical protein [bacterium]